MQAMAANFGSEFFLIIHGAHDMEDDFFVIPYDRVKDVLVGKNTTKINDKAKDAKTRTPRWSGNMVNP
jgi:hypothetical protein